MTDRDNTLGDALDVCHCGDYRRDHRPGGCKICDGSSQPWSYCTGFRLWLDAATSAECWAETPV